MPGLGLLVATTAVAMLAFSAVLNRARAAYAWFDALVSCAALSGAHSSTLGLCAASFAQLHDQRPASTSAPQCWLH